MINFEKLEEAKSEAWEWLKYKYERLAGVARRMALISILGTLTLEHLSAEKRQIEVGADKDVSVENVTKGVPALMKKYESNDEAIYTPQISSQNGDVIVNIAQMHYDPLGAPGVEEKKGTIECQKKIEKFILELIEIAKNENTRILFFNEGDIDRVERNENKMKDRVYLDMISKGEITIGDFISQIEIYSKGGEKYTIDKEKYIALHEVKEFINQNMTPDDLTLKGIVSELENSLRQVDVDNIYYCGGMDKLRTENVIGINETDDEISLDEAISVIVNGVYNSEEMKRLNKEFCRVVDGIKREKDENRRQILEAEKRSILDKVEKEKNRIRNEIREKREDAVLTNLLKNTDKEKDDHRKTIYVLNFGAAHDFSNNLKKKNTDMGLLRLNLVSPGFRIKYRIKN